MNLLPLHPPNISHLIYLDIDKGSEHGGSAYSVTLPSERYAVRVDDFHVHVSQMKASNYYGFREEFGIFPDGGTAPWTVGENAQNRVSHILRFPLIAYIHSMC